MVLLDEVGEFGSSFNGRGWCFHPNHVGVAEVLSATGSAEFNGSIDLVEAFGRAECFPVEDEFESEGFGELGGLHERGLVDLREPFIREFLDFCGVASEFRLDGSDTCVRVGAFFSVSAAAENVRLIDGVDVRVDELRGECVGTS